MTTVSTSTPRSAATARVNAASDTPSTVAMPGMVIRAFKENVARVHEVDESRSFE